MDETKWYNLGDDAVWIKQIVNTYVYNQNEYTYCCEMTPSHWLEPVYTSIVVNDDTPDDIREDLYDKYGNTSYEGCYMHVSAVKAHVEKNPKMHDVYGEAESIDDAREYYQGNYVL
jgi:hypothetical protein